MHGASKKRLAWMTFLGAGVVAALAGGPSRQAAGLVRLYGPQKISHTFAAADDLRVQADEPQDEDLQEMIRILRQRLRAMPPTTRPATQPALEPLEPPPPVEPEPKKPEEAAAPTTQPATTVRVPSLAALALQVKGDVEITSLPEQGTLVIEASDEDFEVIQRILSILDQTIPAPEIEIFRLENTQAVKLSQILTPLFQRQVRKGMPAPTFTPEPATNSLIVQAGPDLMPKITEMIRRLDAIEQAPEIEVDTYQLKNAKASQVAPKLEEMLKQFLQTRGVKELPFSIAAEDRTNSIIVNAPETYRRQIERLIKLLDSVPAFTSADMEIIRLRKADAEDMAEVLEEIFNPASGRKTPLKEAVEEMITRLRFRSETGEVLPELNLDKPIKVIPDSFTQSILVSSTPENIVAIKELVALLDRVPVSHDLRVKIFPLKHAVADDLRQVIEDLFQQARELTDVPAAAREASADKAAGEPLNVTGRAMVYKINVVADDRTNTLVVSGTEDSLALVEVMVEQLDKQQPGEFRIYKLAKASVLNVHAILTELFDNRKTAGGKSITAPTLIADESSNSLIVGGSEEDHKTIAGLLTRLDRPAGLNQRIQIFTLKNAQAADVKETLDDVYAKKRAAGVKGDPVTISVDERTNALVVSGSRDDLAAVADIINRIDSTPITRRMRVEVFPLRSADARDLADTLGKLLQGDRGDRATKESVIIEYIQRTEEGRELMKRAVKEEIQIFAEETTNLLIVLAPEDSIELLAALIQHVESLAPSIEVRVYELKNAQATQLKKTLDDLFRLGRRAEAEVGAEIAVAEGAAEAVSKIEKELLGITADERTNSLIVTGTRTYVQLVGQVIELLDAKEIEPLQTEVIALKNAEAADIESAISTLVKNQISLLKDIYGPDLAPERLLEQQVNIVSDEKSRKVIVQAAPRYMDKIKKIIEELDQPTPQVMIQALLVEVTLNNRLEFGFEAVGQDLAFTKASAGTGIGPKHDIIVGTDVGAAGSSALAGFTLALNSEDLNLLLRAFESEGRLNILSRPQIMARDNTEAEITIGQETPFPSGTNIDPSTGNITTSPEYKDIGIRLTVTPIINPDGFVNLDVQVEDSSASGSSVPLATGVNAPIFNRNAVQAQVRIKDGETIVIGGLFRTRDNKTENKVPILGDIPLLQYLFKSVSDEQEQTELLIILTPRLVSTVEQARELSRQERDLMGLMPDEVLGSKLMGGLRVVPEQPEDQAATQPQQQQDAVIESDKAESPPSVDQPTRKQAPDKQPARIEDIRKELLYGPPIYK